MKPRKLFFAAMVPLIALSIVGCKKEEPTKEEIQAMANQEYHFQGEIDETKLHFYEEELGKKNILATEQLSTEYDKDLKTVVEYIDRDDDFKLDRVNITYIRRNTGTERWTNIIETYYDGEDFLQEFEDFQKDFGNYLEKILEEKGAQK